jgi:YfiH family protein
MDYKKSGLFYSIPHLEKIDSLVHGFGTRHLEENEFFGRQEWEDFRIVSLQQIHSNIVHQISTAPADKLTGDALLTDRPKMILVIETADCLPVLLVDEIKGAIGAVHCGWKGTAMGVLQKAVQALRDGFGSNPASLLVALGPSIEEGCYEVGRDVYTAFQKADRSLHAFRPHSIKKGKYVFNLREANRQQLLEMEVKERNIFSVDLCTLCERALLSYRANSQISGRMLNYIGWSK